MKKIFFAAALLAAMASCSKEQANNQEAPQPSGNEVAVGFSGSEVVVTPTKADAALPSGTKAKITAYLGENIDAASAKVVAKDYTATSEGVLGVTSPATEMFLPQGSYNFYSVGVIGTGAVPTLDATQATGLVSGVDYIVAKGTKAVVATVEGRKVPLAYTHATSKVLITVVKDDASIASIESITSITITPSQGPWTLPVANFASVDAATGVSAVAATPVAMTAGSGNTYSYLMLPLVADKEVSFTIVAQIKLVGATAASEATFTGKITSPATTGFVGGKSYAYNAKVSSGAISFSGATVSDWTEGNTGVTGDLPTEEQ